MKAPLAFRRPAAGRRAAVQPPAGTWDDLLAAFLAAQDSPATVSIYRRYVGAFLAHCGHVFTPPTLAAYRASLTDDGRTPGTHGLILASARSFLRWARLHGAVDLTAEQVTHLLPSPRAVVVRPYQILSEGEARAMLAAVADSPRDLALLATLLSAGLRAAECRGLDLPDLITDEQHWSLHVRRGKGAKDRVTPISDEVAGLIRAYLKASKCKLGRDSGALWLATGPGAAGRRLSTRMLAYVVERAVQATGIAKRVTPHSLRHSAAVNFLRNGGTSWTARCFWATATFQRPRATLRISTLGRSAKACRRCPCRQR
jgi:site-specific recombinase XerD